MESSTYRIGIISLALLLIFSLGIVACDNSIDPFETEVGLFSVYGGLDLNSDKNHIRVMDLNTPLNAPHTELNAIVEFQNLNTGFTEILNDTLVQFDDVNTFNFIKTGEIFPKTEYKVTVTRDDGLAREVFTRTPPKANHIVEGENRSCFLPVTIILDNVDEDDTILLNISFEYDNQIFESPLQLRDPPERTDDGGLQIQFRPQQVLNPFFGVGAVLCDELSDDTFFVEYTHFGPGFKLNSSTSDKPFSTSRLVGFYRETTPVVVDTSCVANRTIEVCLSNNNVGF